MVRNSGEATIEREVMGREWMGSDRPGTTTVSPDSNPEEGAVSHRRHHRLGVERGPRARSWPSVSAAKARNKTAGMMETRRCQKRGCGCESGPRQASGAPSLWLGAADRRPPSSTVVHRGMRLGNALGKGLFARVLDDDRRCHHSPDRGGDG